MATCSNCGREKCPTETTGIVEDDHAAWDCELAAHARTRAELAAARASSPPSPGLVEAARNLSMELEDWFGMDCESAPPAITKAFNALRAALPKEPTP